MMANTRRKFTAEFKQEAVRLAQQPGVSTRSVAMNLGLDVSVLRRWVEKAQSRKGQGRARRDGGHAMRASVPSTSSRRITSIANSSPRRPIARSDCKNPRRLPVNAGLPLV